MPSLLYLTQTQGSQLSEFDGQTPPLLNNENNDTLYWLLYYEGSTYSVHTRYGFAPTLDIPINPLSTRFSDLHYNNSSQKEGYSVVGKDTLNYLQVAQDYTSYNDGDITNILPPPTQLDLNDPIGPDPFHPSKYTSRPGGGYIDNLPK